MKAGTSGWIRIGTVVGVGLALFLSQGKGSFLNGIVAPEAAFAQEDEGGHPLNDRYDSAVARAEARYHQAVANARKIYLENKRKADAVYEHETSVSSRHVTETINEIKNKMTQTGGAMGDQVTSSIKAAVAKYAKTISEDFKKRQLSVKKSVDTYVKALSDATATFGKDIEKADGKISGK